jgi:glycosyltransferase involved in cell wall biosynthesis
MKIIQATWLRFHHVDMARELHELGHLEKIFTCLPWFKVEKESREQNIPKELFKSNMNMQLVRRLYKKLPYYNRKTDSYLGVLETKYYSNWVARNLTECDAFIGISGTGLKAGRLAKSRGAGYIMDRGSSQIRFQNELLKEEYSKWKLPFVSDNPWLIENEEAEAEEANLITVPSNFVRDSFIKTGTNPGKLRVVPYGVNLSEFYSNDTPKEDCFRILFVGNFCIRKGAPYLLEAFKIFNHPKKELIVVGSVSPELKFIIAKYSDQNIKFVGTVARSEVKNFMSTSHAMVIPSIEEGLALVQAQALACGCPVIATPNTGSENLFSDGVEGLIVEARNVIQLVDAFTKLVENPDLRREMSTNAITRVQKLDGWKNYGQQIFEVAKEANNITSGNLK